MSTDKDDCRGVLVAGDCLLFALPLINPFPGFLRSFLCICSSCFCKKQTTTALACQDVPHNIWGLSIHLSGNAMTLHFVSFVHCLESRYHHRDREADCLYSFWQLWLTSAKALLQDHHAISQHSAQITIDSPIQVLVYILLAR